MKKIIFFIVLFMITTQAFSQNVKKEFSSEAFLFYVKKYHPVAKQAKILIDKANAEVLSSKGAFDPVLYSYLDEKNFSDKNYYSLLDAGLKVPTWYGLEFKTGFSQNSGNYLNPENKLPYNGLFQAGVNISLLQGLVIDERRASLNKAKALFNYSKAEQELLLNDLILDAITAYWTWVKNYQQVKIQQEAAQLAFNRFSLLKETYKQGDIPAIDTLESYMQYQLRTASVIDAIQNLQESQYQMSTYLWYENNLPLEITDSLSAPDLTKPEFTLQLDTLTNKLSSTVSTNHPFIRQYDYKIKELEIDRKLKLEKLKPKLNLNYNLINEPVNPIPFDGLNMQNTKWGVSFSYPIFIRKERGDLKIAGLKIQETDLSRELKRYELNNKLRAIIVEQNSIKNQITIYRNLVENYQKMLNAEIDKFNNGESSVFLLNTREMNLIQAQLNFININARYQMVYYKRMWIEGTLAQ